MSSHDDLFKPKSYNDGYLEEMKKQTSGIEQDSLKSTQRVLARLQQTDEIAGSSMTLLQQQSETLGNIERNIIQAGEDIATVDQKVDKLTALNRFFMFPVFKSPKLSNLFKKSANKETPVKPELERPAASQLNSPAKEIEKEETATDSINQNLDLVSSHVSKLKMMGLDFGKELDAQSGALNKINTRMDNSNELMTKVNRKVNKLLD
ncbi:Synaptosomal-associated protein 23 [Terramyces sp. JEL0728]|nr:Synaptosomal-associated protein 23 [Terramyces sp. JEL0728]